MQDDALADDSFATWRQAAVNDRARHDEDHVLHTVRSRDSFLTRVQTSRKDTDRLGLS